MTKENKNPNVPNLRFCKYSENWTQYRVEDILFTFPTNSLSWELLSYDKESEIKNIHYGLIHNGFSSSCITGLNSLLPYIDSSHLPSKFELLKNGDLVLADASEDRKDVGKPVEIIDIKEQKIVSGLHTIHARDKTNLIVLGYKSFYFQSYAMKQQLYKVANGSKIFGISPSIFKELTMYLPCKEEQTKIVNLLCKLEERIIVQIKIIKAYQSFINGLCLELIINKEGNTKIGNCLDCNTSNIKESDLDEMNIGDYAVYGANGCIKNVDSYQTDKNSIGIIKDGAGVGRIMKLKGKYSVIGTLNFLTAKNGYDIDYIYYALKMKSFRKLIVGSGIPHIYYKDYKKDSIYIPENSNKTNAIVKILNTLDERIVAEKKFLSLLEQKKSYLLKNMFV